MRALGSVFILLLVATSSAAGAEEPTAPVAKAYEIDTGDFAVTKGLMPWDSPSREALFSERMAALFARDARYGQESHSVGLLDFDPFLNRQCCGMKDLKLEIVSRGDDKAVVLAKFEGVGAQKVQFDTVLERGVWRIDNIRSFPDANKGAPVSIEAILQGQHDCGSDVGKPCEWPPQVSPLPAGAAPAKVSPADIVRTIYKAAFKGAGVGDQTSDYSAYGDEALRAKYFSAALRKATDGIDAVGLKYHGEVLDFDPILSANGFADPSNFVVRPVKSDTESALVVASFGKGKNRASVAYRLVKDWGEWRVDDISSAPGAKGTGVWSLRQMYDEAIASLPRK